MSNSVTTVTDPVLTGGSLFSIGAELLSEVQHIVGQSKIKSLRVNLGNKPLKEFPVTPASAVVTVALVVAAVLISNLRVEVVKETP